MLEIQRQDDSQGTEASSTISEEIFGQSSRLSFVAKAGGGDFSGAMAVSVMAADEMLSEFEIYGLPELSSAPGEGLTPRSPNETNDSILEKLSESSDEKERNVAEAVQKLLQSTEPAEQKEGKQLLAMLNDDKKRVLAVATVDQLTDPEARRTFLDLLNKWKMSPAAIALSDMLQKTADSSAPAAVQILMQMLKSDHKETKPDAVRLVEMLNTPADAATARLLMEKLAGRFGGVADIRRMFKLMNDPQQKDAANVILELMKSEKSEESTAGRNLLNFLTNAESPVSEADKMDLLTMIGGKRREDVFKILDNLNDPTEIQQMLKLAGDLSMERASTNLLGMLGDENSRRSASELLRALGSKIEVDQKDGQRLLKMLNSETPGDNENAEKVLRFVTGLTE